MSYPPTERPAAALAFIRRFSQANAGRSPTFEEIKQALGLKSKSRVAAILDQLEERGHVRRLRKRERCIELVESTPAEAHFAFDGYGPFAADIKPDVRAARAYAMSDRISFRPEPAAIRATRWLRTFAIDERARKGCLQALNELPSLDRRHLLHSFLPPGSVKPKPATERRVSA